MCVNVQRFQSLFIIIITIDGCGPLRRLSMMSMLLCTLPHLQLVVVPLPICCIHVFRGGLRQFIPEQRPAFIAMTCFKAWCAGTLLSSLTTCFLVDYVSIVRQEGCIKNYKSWLAVDKIIASINRFTFWPCVTADSHAVSKQLSLNFFTVWYSAKRPIYMQFSQKRFCVAVRSENLTFGRDIK